MIAKGFALGSTREGESGQACAACGAPARTGGCWSAATTPWSHSDAMDAARKGYGLLKLVGNTEGLNIKRKELKGKLMRRRSKEAKDAA